jgi:DNA-binding CsgD family transcriptional regulator
MCAATKLKELDNCEKQVLQLIAKGKTARQIPRILHISANRLRTCKEGIRQKLGGADKYRLMWLGVLCRPASRRTGIHRVAAPLSVRELEVFSVLGEGKSPLEIARRSRVTLNTIHRQILNIKHKLRLSHSYELMRAAVRWREGVLRLRKFDKWRYDPRTRRQRRPHMLLIFSDDSYSGTPRSRKQRHILDVRVP